MSTYGFPHHAQHQPSHSKLLSRRQMLRSSACGFGHVALLSLLQNMTSTLQGAPVETRGEIPHFASKAKRVIFLFMHGGVSHIDTFDPKPKLVELNGKSLPFDAPLQFSAGSGTLMQSPWRFRPYGECGLPVSDLFPHVGEIVDDLCIVRSMFAEQVDHGGATLQLHTGSAVFPRPSMGAWVCYGLGSENDNLPSFITISPPMLHGAEQLFGSGFLSAMHQGTPIGNYSQPMKQSTIRNLRRAEPTDELERAQLDLLQQLDGKYAAAARSDSRLESRIQSFELAFRMQMEAPDALDINSESESTLKLYGVNRKHTDNFGRQCLLARRLVERGVRFVQCSHSYKWDQHKDLKKGHETNAREVDLPIAGLIKDLKQRGLLDETLVIWGTEFGRTPTTDGEHGTGRDHNPYGYSIWMAGGGVKGGLAYGATDELGYFAVENRVSLYDLHATILHILGIDHTRLTYRYSGRDFRLTDVHGKVVHDILT